MGAGIAKHFFTDLRPRGAGANDQESGGAVLGPARPLPQDEPAPFEGPQGPEKTYSHNEIDEGDGSGEALKDLVGIDDIDEHKQAAGGKH